MATCSMSTTPVMRPIVVANAAIIRRRCCTRAAAPGGAAGAAPGAPIGVGGTDSGGG